MPERGTAVCQDCGENIPGIYPNHKRAGVVYSSTDRRCLFNEATIAALQAHHNETGDFVRHGHTGFIVFLPNGRIGEASVNSYCVIYYEDPNAPKEVPNAPEEE